MHSLQNRRLKSNRWRCISFALILRCRIVALAEIGIRGNDPARPDARCVFSPSSKNGIAQVGFWHSMLLLGRLRECAIGSQCAARTFLCGQASFIALNLAFLPNFNQSCAAKEAAGEKITPLGLPLPVEEHGKFITSDCIQVEL
jgi:hypothetical protein